jgi:FOG: Ankyrin repeat
MDIFEAVRHGSVDRVRRFLDDVPPDQRQALVNQPDWYGKTPLHHAVSCGRDDVAQLLIKAGANVHAKEKDGSTLLHLAASYEDADLAETLIDAGIDVNKQNFGGITPLHIATIYGIQKVVLVLTTAKEDVNIQDKEGKTPLHCAAKNDKKVSAQRFEKLANEIGVYYDSYINPHELSIKYYIIAEKLSLQLFKCYLNKVLTRALETSKTLAR